MELTPQNQSDDLAKLDAMIAAEDPDFFKEQQAPDNTPKDELRELDTEVPGTESGKQTEPEAKQETQQQDKKPQEQEQPQEDESHLSAYERQKRKNAREWQRIQKKDAAQAAFEDQLKRREAALAERERQSQPKQETQQDIDQKQLEAAMEVWKKQGRSDLIELGQQELERMAKAKAQSAQHQPGQIPAPARPPEVDKAMAQSWEKAKTDYPDLMAPGSPLNHEFRKFAAENADIFEHPKAPILVAEFIDAKLRAARLPELTATITKLQNELQELRTRTSIPSGGSAPNQNPRKFTDLSLTEMEAELEREFASR